MASQVHLEIITPSQDLRFGISDTIPADLLCCLGAVA